MGVICKDEDLECWCIEHSYAKRKRKCLTLHSLYCFLSEKNILTLCRLKAITLDVTIRCA